MIPEKSLISVELPDIEGEVQATVISCSKQGRNCKIRLQNGDVISINIAKCKHSILSSEDTQQEPNGLVDHEENGEHKHSEIALDLDSFRDVGADINALERLIDTVDPSTLLKPSTDIADVARTAAKELIEYASKQSSISSLDKNNRNKNNTNNISSMLLHVDGFDPEQIWLQLDMLSEPALKRIQKVLRKADGVDRLIPQDIEDDLDDLLAVDASDASDDELEDEMDTSDNDEEEEEEEEEIDDDDDDTEWDYEAMLEQRNEDEDVMHKDSKTAQNKKKASRIEKKVSIKKRMTNEEAIAAVEDDFMKLDEMEAFLKAAEEQEYASDDENTSDIDDDAFDPEKNRSSDEETDDNDDENDNDDDLDALLDNAYGLVGKKRKNKDKKKRKRGISSFDSEEEEEEEEEDDDSVGNARYEDFFGPRSLPKHNTASIPPPSSSFGGGARMDQVMKKKGVSKEQELDPFIGVLTHDLSSESEEEESGEEESGEEESGEEESGEEESGEEEEEEAVPTTKHQRKLQNTSNRIKALERQAMAEKDWFLRGEVAASHRPKNSALEIDLDFETTVKPPPAPTVEMTKSLEDLIKARIAEGKFDSPIGMAPPPPERKKTTVELDDKKSTVGLGEMYEADYMTAVTGMVEDKDVPVRQLATAQFQAVSSLLDQLSHGHYRPAPSIEEVTFKVDVPAILMEESAPAFVSAASMRAPEEVYKSKPSSRGGRKELAGDETATDGGQVAVLQAGGGYKTEAELTKEDRKRRRAAKKRAAKKRGAQKEEEGAQRAAARGQVPVVLGRKSEAEQQALRKMSKASKTLSGFGGGINGGTSVGGIKYTKSSDVFAKIQSYGQEGAGEKKKKSEVNTNKMNYKL